MLVFGFKYLYISVFFLTLVASSVFNSKNLGLKIQKKVAGKFSTKSIVKNFIDDEISCLLDQLHIILSEEVGSSRADKIIKNLIRVTIKIGILFKNNQFSNEELSIGLQLRKKLRNAALTIISFHEVDFSYDHAFIIKLVEEIGSLLHQLVNEHLTQKSHQRIDSVIDTFSNKELLDMVFVSGAKYHSHLPEISKAFEKVVEIEW